MSKNPRTALIMAGGTGGHIFPGLAVAEQLRIHGWKVHWLVWAVWITMRWFAAASIDSWLTVLLMRWLPER